MDIYYYNVYRWCENGGLMKYLLYICCGIVAGILGGMGMGGGTLLIPLLTILLGFNQKFAQTINLISFSIMAFFVIMLHIKNKLINLKIAIKIASFALFFSIFGSFLANYIKISILKVLFGTLLITIAVGQAITEIINYYKN